MNTKHFPSQDTLFLSDPMHPLIAELQGAGLGEWPRRTAPVVPIARSAAPAATAPGLPLNLRGIGKAYGPRQVLADIDLDIAAGEFVAVVGRSGCGKSTLLRLLAQLEPPGTGQLLADGTEPLARHREDIRIMFQDARLLPWRRVFDNVTLGLPQARRPQASDVLAQVGLAERQGDWPARLSGGQRQRVALARALVHQPRLLLLDEPLGALDALTRLEMQRLIESLWLRNGFTALLVTHDVQEAVALADRVILIEQGRIALDVVIDQPRPRALGNAALAALEQQILDRVLQQPDRPAPQEDAHWPGVAAHGLRWAV
jgi:sulfonate transport system ATP-binding protein